MQEIGWIKSNYCLEYEMEYIEDTSLMMNIPVLTPAENSGPLNRHGLPIELKALQTLPMAPNGDKPNPMEIRKHAKECALEAITSQRDDFWRWGVMADWEWDGQRRNH